MDFSPFWISLKTAVVTILIVFFLGELLGFVNKFVVGGAVVVSISVFCYYLTAKKKTVKGNDEYNKWNGLKNFMNDFGRMHEKELPEIILWEKYLVYATVFGCAKKLAKDMKIKVQEFEQSGSFNYDYVAMNSLINMPSVISSTISQVKSSADNAYSIAHSTSSSGIGSGGGFSSGGGSFGGGGGGGRPNMAQAGGKNPAGIKDAIAEAKTALEAQIK